jgi:hypothetical protein
MKFEMEWRRLGAMMGTVIAMAGFSLGADDNPSDLKPLYDLAGDHYFKEYAGNPILKPDKGTCDGAALGTMTVVKVNGVYHMYYEAWGAGDHDKSPMIYYHSLQICHATSTDGIHWTKDPANPVIPHGGPKDFDHGGTWDPFVLHEDGILKMWYGGGVDVAGPERVNDPWGFAESTDGYHWVKKGQLTPEAVIPHVEDDRVVHDKKTGHYFMYYLDRGPKPMLVMRAESPDEMHFDFDHAIPIHIQGIPGGLYKYPQTFQVGDTWYMLYGRPGGGSVDDSTGLASSPDGVHWTGRNLGLLPRCHDSALLKVADDLYVIYYGPNKQQDLNNCDIRMAVFKGTLDDMLAPRK